MSVAGISNTKRARMRLHIGKNHWGKTSNPVQSIFRLAGSDEDALTYALGFLLAHDPQFCTKLVRLLRVGPRHSLSRSYSIHLQEVTGPRFGRRDIVIEDSGVRIVLEAKVGGAEPTDAQLLMYAEEEDLWNQYSTRGLVALTQVKLAPARSERLRSRLAEKKICFNTVQWHQIVDLALGHRPFVDSGELRYLFDEFISFIRKDYRMGYYDAEILIQDVNALNAKIFKEGWMYVTAPKDKKAPLYFAPYFTRNVDNSGLSMISRVVDTEIAVLARKADVIPDSPSSEHQEHWNRGLAMLRERAELEGFAIFESRLFYLDRPMTFATPPLTKKSFNTTGPSKKMPSQIPKGFTLRFDELLRTVLAAN